MVRFECCARFAAFAILLGACSDSKAPSPLPTPSIPSPTTDEVDASASTPFRDESTARGLDFVHDSGRSPKRFIPEIIAGGVAFIDFDGDGDYDVYFTSACGLPMSGRVGTHAADRLYANDGAGHFSDATLATGLGDEGFGIGVAVGDIDGDGDADLFVTRYGANLLYRNEGGHFAEIAVTAGVAGDSISSSACFVDYDRDGDLDLYVVNYVDFDPAEFDPCTSHGHEVYCNPSNYVARPDRLYRNDGTGRFRDVTAESGIVGADGKGLGVVAGDIDGDGDVDLYVANDGTANHLYVNQSAQGQPRFSEEALYYGAAYSENAMPEAGMGTDMGDFDGDGDLDIVVANLVAQTNALYRNDGDATMTECSYPRGIGAGSLPYVAFGVRFIDFDLDRDLDLFVANGHVIDNVAELGGGEHFTQPDFLWINDDGAFSLHANPCGSVDDRVGRALATADVDDDGDLDMLIVNLDAAPRLLINQAPEEARARAVGLRLITASRRDAYHAKVWARGPDRQDPPSYREVRASGSYLASSDPRLIIPAPAGVAKLRIDIEWPDGRRSSHDVEVGQYHTIREGDGITAWRPFRK